MAVSNEREHIAYWAALGRFIHHFAEMELIAKILLATVVGSRKGMVQAIWSGTRANDALSLVRRVYDSDGREPNRFYVRAMEQFGHLNGLRNAVAHLPVDDSSGQPIVSTFSKAIPGKHVEYQASPEMLTDATRDVQTVWSALSLAVYEESEKKALPEAWVKLAHSAWRYKPPSQTAGGHTQAKKDRSRPSHPRPSHR